MTKLIRDLSVASFQQDLEAVRVCRNGWEWSSLSQRVAHLEYVKGALVPKSDWQPLNSSEIELLKSEGDYGDISLIAIESGLKDKLQKAIHSIKDFSSRRHMFPHELLDAVGDTTSLELMTALDSYMQEGKRAFVDVLQRSRADQYTTTYNGRLNAYVGMHVDEESGADVYNCAFSPSRLCINLGKESRYFVFCNLSVSTMYSCLQEKVSDDSPPGLIGHSFLVENPLYPILRLELKPGEGYIAPVANMLHDGSTYGSNSDDVTLVIKGDFVGEAC